MSCRIQPSAFHVRFPHRKRKNFMTSHVTLWPGQNIEFEICARAKWNHTPLLMKTGEQYSFEAAGTWHDAQIECGPDGHVRPSWLFRLAERFRRRANDRWFALIGALNEEEGETFLIGSAASLAAAKDAMLSCYANDLLWMYFNNFGSVKLSVTRNR